MSKKQSTGVYFDDETLEEINVNMKRANCRSRSEFVKNAVRFYLGYLETGANGSTLFPVLDDALDGRMKDMETRLARTIFKLAVEVAIGSHVIAGTNDVSDEQVAAIRKLCEDEVRRLSGRYRFEDILKFQE